MKFDGETSDEKEDSVILGICRIMEKYDMRKYSNSIIPHLISSLDQDMNEWVRIINVYLVNNF